MSETSIEERHTPRRQARGTLRRDAIVRAATDLILHEGPGAVTHRAVAARANVPLAATTYYFSGLDDLMAAAGEDIASGWAAHARAEADTISKPRHTTAARRVAAHLVGAVFPDGGATAIRGFYEHLVGVGRYPALVQAYADGRKYLDDVIAEMLRVFGVPSDPVTVVALIDGAAVSALSEGLDAHEHAVALVERFVTTVRAASSTKPTE